ncbi:MAG TPA: hypothetical protein VK610_07550 [Rhodothermales bacterium]|nr:hypothetical protein [Rhodothermales bacterium]
MTRLLLALALLLPLAACGGGDDGPTADDGPLGAARRMGEAAEQMGEAAEQMGEGAQNGTPVEPVDFRRLREMLPEEVVGLARTNLSGERQGFGGMNVSQAQATYEGTGADGATSRLELKVADLGGVGMAAMFGAAWTMASVDRESERDYERTVRIDGNPGYEKYDTVDRRGDFQVLVADRFLVTSSGSGLDDDQFRDALRAVDLDALEGMRDEGR